MARNTPPSLISYTELAFTTTGTPRSSASISWNAGDVIVIVEGIEGGIALGTPTVTGLTFTSAAANSAANTCGTAAWKAVAAAGGSGAISCPGDTNLHWGAGVWVWRGSDGAGVGFEAHSAVTAATAITSVTPTDTHSAFCWGVFDFGAGAAGGSVLTPTPTNARHQITADGTHYSYSDCDLTDKASSAAANFGITSGDTSTGPYSIIGIEVLGTTISSGLLPVWPTRIESTRNRNFFAVRSRRVSPAPVQVSPVPWRQPSTAASRARLTAIAPKGRRSFPVQPQIPVPAPVFPTRAPMGRRWAFLVRGKRSVAIPAQEPAWPVRIESVRSRFTMLRRGRQVAVTPPQVPVPAPVWPNRSPSGRRWVFPVRGRRSLPTAPQEPSWPPRASSARSRFAMLRKGRQVSVVPPQVPVPSPAIPRTATPWRWAALRKGRATNPVLTQAPSLAPPWPTPKLGAARRLLGGAQRGRQSFPVQPQVPVPNPVFPNRQPAGRRLLGLARGKRMSTAPLVQDQPNRVLRQPAKLGGWRRGKPTPVVPTTTPLVPPAWPPPKSGAPRRLLSGAQRGRRSFPTQTPPVPPKPVFANRQPALRKLLAPTRPRRTWPIPPGAAAKVVGVLLRAAGAVNPMQIVSRVSPKQRSGASAPRQSDSTVHPSQKPGQSNPRQ